MNPNGQSALPTMRLFDNHIRAIIEASKLKLNTISKTSGISHTYLTKLVNDHINRPGKDKIASIMLALNYSIDDINAALAGYDYQALDEPDIPEILKNNRKRKIRGNTLALYDDIHVKLLLSPMERQGGKKILVKKAPSVMFMPDELYMGAKPDAADNDPPGMRFYHAFTTALFKERKAIFQKHCEEGAQFETFICRRCLEDYIKKNMDVDQGGQPLLALRYFANAAAAIRKTPDQHRTWIMERCPWFDFMIQGDDQEAPKVFFFGKKRHDYGAAIEQSHLQGFTSDSMSMIDLFRKEAQHCRNAVDPFLEENYPDALIRYFRELFEPFGYGDMFEAFIDGTDSAQPAMMGSAHRPGPI
jgi:transcriptional regulator with XRE-family HTH domain